MNAAHLWTFLWLRWRLFANQMRRAGAVNAVLTSFMAVAALFVAAALFLIFFFVGLLALPTVDPSVLLYVWDGLVMAFLFTWSVGLLVQLQRSEVLSLDKFLHLPVSLSGAFFINYLSSLATLSMVVFLPAMVAPEPRPDPRPGTGPARSAAAVGRLLSHGHGLDVPVPGLAGVADGQPAPAAHGGRAGDGGVHSDLPAAEHHRERLPSLGRAPGAASSRATARKVGRPSASSRREKSPRRSSRSGRRTSCTIIKPPTTRRMCGTFSSWRTSPISSTWFCLWVGCRLARHRRLRIDSYPSRSVFWGWRRWDH